MKSPLDDEITELATDGIPAPLGDAPDLDLVIHEAVLAERDRPFPKIRPVLTKRPRLQTLKLSVEQILGWADAYFAIHGRWPCILSGKVEGGSSTWLAINLALRRGTRGLPAGGSLSKLLLQERGVSHWLLQTPFDTETILTWAEAFHERCGYWPGQDSGPIEESPGTTWKAVHMALIQGSRGLPGGTTLSRLLQAKLGARHRLQPGDLTSEEILKWMRAYYERHGKWPRDDSGPVPESPGDTWNMINKSLREGRRSLPPGGSLVKLLDDNIRVINHEPSLAMIKQAGCTVDTGLVRADACESASATLPQSGTSESSDGSRRPIDRELDSASHRLRAKSPEPTLLVQEREERNRTRERPLTEDKILEWADAFHARQAKWPRVLSGPIQESPGDNWQVVHAALAMGHRGLTGGDTLARLLDRERGARNYAQLPRLTVETVLGWADAYHVRHGSWPTQRSGRVDESPADTWLGISQALTNGHRGLPGGTSLIGLLQAQRGTRNRLRPPALTLNEIEIWATAFHARNGRWPTLTSGHIEQSPGDTWLAIHSALKEGRRGLPGGITLAGLTRKLRGFCIPEVSVPPVYGKPR